MSDKLDLIETLKHEQKWSTFSRMLNTTGADAWIKGEGDFTVFAPTNDAFAKIPDAKMTELLNEPNQAMLKSLISYHILKGKLQSANFNEKATREAVTGEEITFTESDGLKINGARVQARNIQATNGVIHQVDTVLAPPVKTAAVAAGASEAAKTTAAAPTTTPLTTPPAIAAAVRKETTIL
jgi:uncharacterized surface protein with fasciclin (FAS1) repeats